MPYLDWTLILPPIISTNFLVIARPSPVPSVVVFRSIPSLSNFVNNFVISSSLIPRPVSCTAIIKLHISLLFIHLTDSLTTPSSVYLIELESKLLTICFTWVLSPNNSYGRSGAISNLKSIGLSPILVASILASVSISSLGL